MEAAVIRSQTPGGRAVAAARTGGRSLGQMALFWLLVTMTVGILLTPGAYILAAKVWVASWLPWGQAMADMEGSGHADKLVHAAMFAVTAGAGVRAWLGRSRLTPLVVALLLLGVLTECLQAYVPGRGPSVADGVADALGVTVGVVVCLVAMRGRNKSV